MLNVQAYFYKEGIQRESKGNSKGIQRELQISWTLMYNSQDPLSNNHYIATNVLLLSILTSLFQVTSNLTKMAIIITQSFNLGYFYFSSCLTLLEIDIFFLSPIVRNNCSSLFFFCLFFLTFLCRHTDFFRSAFIMVET